MRNEYVRSFHPDILKRWKREELKMWPVLMNHLEPHMARMPIADLLLAAYLIGLNHMLFALDAESKNSLGDGI